MRYRARCHPIAAVVFVSTGCVAMLRVRHRVKHAPPRKKEADWTVRAAISDWASIPTMNALRHAMGLEPVAKPVSSSVWEVLVRSARNVRAAFVSMAGVVIRVVHRRAKRAPRRKKEVVWTVYAEQSRPIPILTMNVRQAIAMVRVLVACPQERIPMGQTACLEERVCPGIVSTGSVVRRRVRKRVMRARRPKKEAVRMVCVGALPRRPIRTTNAHLEVATVRALVE